VISLLLSAGYAVDPVARRTDGRPFEATDAMIILALVAAWCAEMD